jgi:hypothetical protein
VFFTGSGFFNTFLAEMSTPWSLSQDAGTNGIPIALKASKDLKTLLLSKQSLYVKSANGYGIEPVPIPTEKIPVNQLYRIRIYFEITILKQHT